MSRFKLLVRLLLCGRAVALRLGNGTTPQVLDDKSGNFQHMFACSVASAKRFGTSDEFLEAVSLPSSTGDASRLESDMLRSTSLDACTASLPPSDLISWQSSGDKWREWLYQSVDVRSLTGPAKPLPPSMLTSHNEYASWTTEADSSPSSDEDSSWASKKVVVVVRVGPNRTESWMKQHKFSMKRNTIDGVGLRPLVKCPLVGEVHLMWWPQEEAPLTFGEYQAHGVKVNLRNVSSVPFGERYNLRKNDLYNNPAEFMLSLDDDMSFNCLQLTKMVYAARREPTRIVSPEYFCRSLIYNDKSHPAIQYGKDAGLHKNMALPGLGLMTMNMMRRYTDQIVPKVQPITNLISKLINGEDVLLNFGFAALNADGRSENCVNVDPIRLNDKGGIWCAPCPWGTDCLVWEHRRDIVSNIVARAFPACAGFRGLADVVSAR